MCAIARRTFCERACRIPLSEITDPCTQGRISINQIRSDKSQLTANLMRTKEAAS